MEETPQKPEKKLNPNREKLLPLSADAKALKEKMIQESEDPDTAFWWEAQTINAILLRYFYKIPEGMELGTFHQWKAKGCMIKKGEKSIVIWGQPLRAQRAEQAKAKGQEVPAEDEDSGDYFPMCFLFRADQVLTPEELEEERTQRQNKAEKREQIKQAIETLQTVDLDTVI
jgi:antirestriction protein ArdC